jgi:Dolichyl-phosphate-mannose-protein mannosyltransferase
MLLDVIFLPFFMSSILFTVKFKESVNSNKKHESEIEFAIFSGISLGLAILTKIPDLLFSVTTIFNHYRW